MSKHRGGVGLNVKPHGVQTTEPEGVALMYLAVVETMRICMKHASVSDPDGFDFGGRLSTDKRQRDFGRYLWTMLKRSKLIAIPPELYTSFHHKWDRAIVEELGYTWRPPNFKGRPAPKEEVRRTIDHTRAKTLATPFPERLPFDVVYLAFGGSGVGLTSLQVMNKAGHSVASRMRNVSLLGALISDLGLCVEFFIGFDTQSRHPSFPTIFNSFQRGPLVPGFGNDDETDCWLGPGGKGSFDLFPLILGDIVDHINGFVVLSASKFPSEAKKLWRVDRKKFGVEKGEPPPDFYPYILRSSIHTESVSDVERPRHPMSYRTDVRGHYRLLVRRGPKPMEPRKWAYYVKGEFKVYIDDIPPPEMREKMRVKGHPSKRPDEWMAVKAVWIDSHMSSNDMDLPYRRRLTIA
jgi:hypothetical protein